MEGPGPGGGGKGGQVLGGHTGPHKDLQLRPGGLYQPLSTGSTDVRKVIGIAAAGGVALGAASAALARKRQAEHAAADKKET